MVVGWVVALGVGIWAVRRICFGYPPASPELRVLAAREVATLDAIGEVFYPAGHGVAPSGADADVTAYIDALLDAGQPAQRRLIRALLFLLEHGTLLFPAWRQGWRGGSRFSRLDLAAREAYLDGYATSSVFARRLCFTSIRALCTFGYFSDPAVLRELRLAPRAIASPIVAADLLYPRVGASRSSVRLSPADLTPRQERAPLGPEGPLAPGFGTDTP